MWATSSRAPRLPDQKHTGASAHWPTIQEPAPLPLSGCCSLREGTPRTDSPHLRKSGATASEMIRLGPASDPGQTGSSVRRPVVVRPPGHGRPPLLLGPPPQQPEKEQTRPPGLARVLAIGTVTETAVSDSEIGCPRQTRQRQLVGLLELRHLAQPTLRFAWLVPGFTHVSIMPEECPPITARRQGRLPVPEWGRGDRGAAPVAVPGRSPGRHRLHHHRDLVTRRPGQDRPSPAGGRWKA
jgi:hypothetical protein